MQVLHYRRELIRSEMLTYPFVVAVKTLLNGPNSLLILPRSFAARTKQQRRERRTQRQCVERRDDHREGDGHARTVETGAR